MDEGWCWESNVGECVDSGVWWVWWGIFEDGGGCQDVGEVGIGSYPRGNCWNQGKCWWCWWGCVNICVSSDPEAIVGNFPYTWANLRSQQSWYYICWGNGRGSSIAGSLDHSKLVCSSVVDESALRICWDCFYCPRPGQGEGVNLDMVCCVIIFTVSDHIGSNDHGPFKEEVRGHYAGWWGKSHVEVDGWGWRDDSDGLRQISKWVFIYIISWIGGVRVEVEVKYKQLIQEVFINVSHVNTWRLFWSSQISESKRNEFLADELISWLNCGISDNQIEITKEVVSHWEGIDVLNHF